jgi:ketosteroid isomerase-like protein
VSQRNVDAVRACLDAWNRRDVDAWLKDAHADIEWVSAVTQSMEGTDRVYRGMGEMRGFWHEWHSVWDMAIHIEELRDLGDTVLAEGRLGVRGDASGIGLEQPIAYVFEFEDGLARRVHSYFDPQQAREAAEQIP